MRPQSPAACSQEDDVCPAHQTTVAKVILWLRSRPQGQAAGTSRTLQGHGIKGRSLHRNIPLHRGMRKLMDNVHLGIHQQANPGQRQEKVLNEKPNIRTWKKKTITYFRNPWMTVVLGKYCLAVDAWARVCSGLFKMALECSFDLTFL